MKSFYALVDQLGVGSAEQRQSVEKVIWDAFGATQAVLALDMSNFSLFVRRNGILPYLCKVRRMQQVTSPIVRACRGEVVKYEADNMIAAFPDCADAVDAAVQINQASQCVDVTADADLQFAVSIGIDFGKFLWIRGADCFGDPVNRAHKLGEDLARAGEILITREVRDRLIDSPYDFENEGFSIAGTDLPAFRVLYPAS